MTRPTFFQLLGGLLAEDGTLSLRELLDRGAPSASTASP